MTTNYQIAAADLQEQRVACVHGRILTGEIATFLATAYSKVPPATAQQGLRVSGPPYARYRFEKDGTVDVEAGFPVSGAMTRSGDVGPGTLPGGHVLTTLHVGGYNELGDAYDALETHLIANGYEPVGAAWECYLDGPEVPEPRTKVYQPARYVSRRCK
jgi:effector-binding domain-containing protein